MQPTPCPDTETLTQFLSGRASSPDRERLQLHLQGCGCCAETAARLLQSGVRSAAAGEQQPRTGTSIPLGFGDDTPCQPGWAAPLISQGEALFDFLAPPQNSGEIGRLAHYRVLGLLGAGGMGVVFEAEDTRLRRRVALKAMRPALAASPSARQRFLREAHALAVLRHDHIVPIYEVDEDRGIPFLAMPMLQGESLEDRLRCQGRLPTGEVLRIGREVAQGLAAAHEHGLIHRDVKPANIFLEALPALPGSTAAASRVVLLDFGLARAAEGQGQLTGSGVIIGTPAYTSPEQARGEGADQRSDLFSLGAVLYRMCTGQQPFAGGSAMAVLTSLAMDQLRPVREINPDVPPPLAGLVMSLLARDPIQRPASAAEVATCLGRLQTQLCAGQASGTPMLARTQRESAKLGARKFRRRGLVALGALLAIVAAAYFLGGGRIALKKTEAVRQADDPASGPPAAQLTLPPDSKPVPASPQDVAQTEHRTALWVLAHGGRGAILVGDTKTDLAAVRNRQAGSYRVINVQLGPDAKLTDGELSHLEDLPHLQGLQLHGAWVSDASLAQLKGLHQLRRLDVIARRVTDAGLLHVLGLTNLQHLILIETAVTNDGLARLTALTKLQHFELASMRHLTENGMKQVGKLTSLTGWLTISNCGVVDVWIPHLRPLTRLQGLALVNNSVTDAGLPNLMALPHLKELNLRHTAVSDDGLVSLQPLSKLQRVSLAETAVSDAGLINLQGLKDLVIVDLDSCPAIHGPGLSYLAGLPRLQELHLGCPNLTDRGVGLLSRFKNLKQLSLAGSAITDTGLQTLKRLSSLQRLDLTHTQVSARGIAMLRVALPKCQILGPGEG